MTPVPPTVFSSSQIMWGFNSCLFVVGFFFMKLYISSLAKNIKKMEEELTHKLDSIICVERNDSVKLQCRLMAKHKHAPVTTGGSGGEVILP